MINKLKKAQNHRDQLNFFKGTMYMHLAGASKKFIWQVDKNIVMSNKQNKIKTVDNFSDENLTMFIYYFVREIS